MRLRFPITFATAALASVWLCLHLSIRAAEATTPLFNPDPQHISNRLYDQLHVRTDPDGKEHGFDAIDPLLWTETTYLLIGKSHTQALALAEEFLRTHAERQITDPTKRAILQRDIWAVFDWANDPDKPDELKLPHQTERRELVAKLAPIIWRLALSADQLATLPDTYSRAVQDHEFPAEYDPASPNRAFLPPNLFDPSGPWLCLSPLDHDLAAPAHDLSFTARSVFFVFARLPGGRDATLAYFKQLAEMKTPLFVRMQDPGWPQPMDVWNPKVPQFPPGTEFALVRKLILPDQDGHLRLTRVTESVQVRHYTDVPNVNPMASRDVDLARHFQAPSELDLSRTLLFSEHHSGLRGVIATDDPFLILPAMSSGFDIFENERVFEDWRRMRDRHTLSPFVECTSCHLGPGIQSMMSFSFRGSPSEGPVLSPRLAETTPNAETEKVLQWAQTQQKWKDLLQLRASRNPK